MAFAQATIDAARVIAQRNNFDVPAFLAVVEIESNGKPFEDDSVTPRFLFERHKFYSELNTRAPAKLQAAVDAGLAHKDWRRDTQYDDQGSTKGRMALLARARAIDTECANRACSWGLGQLMGFNCEMLGFASATIMVNYMSAGGVQAQVDCMARFIKAKKLAVVLNTHNWPALALGYNGAAYRQNQYDVRLKAACLRWERTERPAPVGMAVLEGPEETPVDRVPVQNAEVATSKIALSPEAISGYTMAASSAAQPFASGSVYLQIALAIILVIAAVVGAYFLIHRMRANPT